MTPSDKDELIVRYHDVTLTGVSMSVGPDSEIKEMSRPEAVALIVESIRQHKPTRVTFDVMGKRHSMARQTVELIVDGKLTAADLTAA